MAAHGLKSLWMLPLLMVLAMAAVHGLMAGGVAILGYANPGAEVRAFLDDVARGDTRRAAARVVTPTSHEELRFLGYRLAQRFGNPVSVETEIPYWSPTAAVVWSTTRTAPGHRYILMWTLVHTRDGWRLHDLSPTRDVAPDLPG
jgi:hypothetical protein